MSNYQPHQPYQPYQPPVAYQPVAVAAPSSGLATASMVLGIIGFFSCGLTSLFAVIFGHVAEIQTRGGRRGGRGQAAAGLVMGYLVVAPGLIFLALIFMGVAAVPFDSTAP